MSFVSRGDSAVKKEVNASIFSRARMRGYFDCEMYSGLRRLVYKAGKNEEGT